MNNITGGHEVTPYSLDVWKLVRLPNSTTSVTASTRSTLKDESPSAPGHWGATQAPAAASQDPLYAAWLHTDGTGCCLPLPVPCVCLAHLIRHVAGNIYPPVLLVLAPQRDKDRIMPIFVCIRQPKVCTSMVK